MKGITMNKLLKIARGLIGNGKTFISGGTLSAMAVAWIVKKSDGTITEADVLEMVALAGVVGNGIGVLWGFVCKVVRYLNAEGEFKWGKEFWK